MEREREGRGGHPPSSWAGRDFRSEAVRRRSGLARGAVAALVTVVAFLVFLLEITYELSGCGDACYDTRTRTYEAGHSWTAYENAWQWQAQWGLALAALLLGLAALASSGRHAWRWWTAGLVAAAVACDLAYAAWRLLAPAIPS